MVFLETVFIALTLVVAMTAGDNLRCTKANFDRYINKRLRCGIFKTLTIDHADCQEMCAATLNCFSTNSYHGDNGQETCELVRGIKDSFNDERCFARKDGGVHSELLVSNFNYGSTRKALPDGSFQFGSSVFKYLKNMTESEAKAACKSNGATLLTNIVNELNSEFIAGVFPDAKPNKPYLNLDKMGATKIWKLDGSDSDVVKNGNATYTRDDEAATTVLELPGTAGSFATTPKFPISQKNSTLSFWIKSPDSSQFTTADTSSQVYSSWGNPHVFAITPRMFTARKVYFQKGTRFKVKHGTALKENQWVHVVGIWNRYAFGEGLASLYINGEKVNQELVKDSNRNGIGFPNPPGDVFDIGYNRETAAVMKGKIRHLVVFDRPLTEEEVKDLKDATYNTGVVTTANVVCKKKV